MAEAESEEAVRLRNKASEMFQSPSSIAFPTSKEHKSSYILPQSVAKMGDEGSIRLQNESCAIREEIGKTRDGEQLVYSSLAHLPTFSIGLSSTEGENPPPAALRESNIDPEENSPRPYFQMPELGARVFIGDRDGFDTILCLFRESHRDLEFHLHFQYGDVRSLYNDDRPGGLSGWLRAHSEDFWRSAISLEVILSGTELFVGPNAGAIPVVGNLGGMSSRVSGSSSDYKDCTGHETIRQPSDIVEEPGAPVPGVRYSTTHWRTIEGPDLRRLHEGSYLEKPKFMKWDDPDLSYDGSEGALHLTKFDDFVILGNSGIFDFMLRKETMNIVIENASETADVIAAQLVKRAMKYRRSSPLCPITVIVIFLDHKEILRREHRKDTCKALRFSEEMKDHTLIKKLEGEKKKTTLKEDEKVFASQMEDNKGIMLEEDHEAKILVGKPLPNVPQISSVSLKENELEMKSTTKSSNLTSAKVQDDSTTLSSVVSIEDDDCKNWDFMLFHYMTKWIIYGDLLERTLLCFFNIEEMQYEFYFEDHENMATIIGLGVPHSKVVLKCGSPHVIVVEIPKEDWDVVWAYSNVIPRSIPKGNILKEGIFPNILHHIANVLNIDNIVSKANDGGVGGDNGKGKGKAQDNAHDSKGNRQGKAHGHDDYGNTSHQDGGSNEAPNENNKERKGKDGNDEIKNGHDQDDGKTSNDCKEIQAEVHLRLFPGGVLEYKEKQKAGEINEVEEKKKKKEEEGSKGVEKKKKKCKRLWHALKRGENGNVVENQQEWTTIEGVENDDANEILKKQLENQIHSQMVFTFSIKNEAGGSLKTIQVTIDPITFQFPSNNKENYLQRRRFGWFHEELQVAFGVVNTQVAFLDSKSCKVLDSSEAKEVNLQGNAKGNAITRSNAYKGAMGIQYGVKASGAYGRTDGSESNTTEQIQNTWETNKTLTKGGFSISEHTNLNSNQLKYSYHPHIPFNEEEFKVKDEGYRLNMYDLNSICQLQRVNCEGTWYPDDSNNLEAYKLEASRKLGMTRLYNLEPKIGEEKKRKLVWNAKPLCFIQTLEKVVYLNHAMSHLTSSTTGIYRLQERQDPSNSSTFVTQAQSKKEPKWPSNDPLVDVHT